MSKWWQLTSFQLKLIAVVTMTIDHIGYFLGGPLWMRAIGRIAFVIFAFGVAEGFVKTRNRTQYLKRLAEFGFGMTLVVFIFSLITQNTGLLSNGNIFLTFYFALLIATGMNRGDSFGLVQILGGMIGTVIFSVDYSFYGIMTVLAFIYFQGNITKQFFAFGVMNILFYGPALFTYGWWSPYSLQMYSLAAFGFIALYNGKLGLHNQVTKYFFYWYYPIHIGILVILGQFIQL
ncbi:MAG: TraX family protein [Culicoidibacterales bacterium]